MLLCFAHLVLPLAVSCPRVLSVALGSCVLWRCVLWFFPALCALCCVCFLVLWWYVLLFAAVVCAVAVLGCLAVRSPSSPLCAVLCCALLSGKKNPHQTLMRTPVVPPCRVPGAPALRKHPRMGGGS